jgi:hypothetical protein
MLTGRRAFAGDDVTDTIAAVVRGEPAWDALPPETPPKVHNLLRRCVEKDPRQRVRDIGDVRLAMGGVFETPAREVPEFRFWQRRVPAATLALILLFAGSLVTGLGVWALVGPGPAALTRLAIIPGPMAPLTTTGETRTIALSPDGRTLVYVARDRQVGRLYVRPLDELGWPSLSARGAFSVSENGRLVYGSVESQVTQLIWFDRAGRELGSVGRSVGYRGPFLSRDERTIAVGVGDTEIWLIEMARGVESRLGFQQGFNFMPVLSPDGSRVVFSAGGRTPPTLHQQDSRAAGRPELLLPSTFAHPTDWSRDGRFVVYATRGQKTQWDLWVSADGTRSLERRSPLDSLGAP